MASVKLDGFIEAFRDMVTALEKTRAASAPIYRDALDDWAETTTRKAVENLDRPNWLLSRSMSHVVRRYEKCGKLWAMSGVTKDGEGARSPSSYVHFHESGWRPNGGKPSAPKKFMARAKRSTTPILKTKIDEATKGVLAVFQKEMEKRKAK